MLYGAEAEPYAQLFYRFIYSLCSAEIQLRQYRLIKTEVSRDKGASWLAASEYDYYLHGPLKHTSLGNKIQDIDLAYNINGWLKAINNPVSSGSFANETGEGGT